MKIFSEQLCLGNTKTLKTVHDKNNFCLTTYWADTSLHLLLPKMSVPPHCMTHLKDLDVIDEVLHIFVR